MSSSLSESERDALRQELAAALDDARSKVGSDGEQLVHFPANFDVVADAMNRSDLTSVEEKPWSKYLLSSDQKFDEALDREGRYHNAFSSADKAAAAEDHKLDGAMAQIQLYDKQLLAISRRAAQVKSSLLRLQNTFEEAVDDEDADRLSTGRSSKKSSFFLTRAKDDKSVASTTPRSEANTLARNVLSPDHFSDGGGVDDYGEEYESSEGRPASDEKTMSRSVTSGGDSKASGISKRNAIRENIMNAAQRGKQQVQSSLSEEEEHRLQTLLDIDENGAAWKSLSNFGFTGSQKEHVALLDEELSRFDRRQLWNDVNYNCAGIEAAARDDSPDKTRPDYLTSQRAAREENAYYNKLDSMIRSFSTQKVDLSGLIVADSSQKSSASFHPESHQRLSTASSLLLDSLPQPSHVDVNRKLSMLDIEAVVESSKALFQQQEQMFAHGGLDNWDQQESSISAMSRTGTLSNLAPRLDIDRLLGSLRFEIQRLSELRGRSTSVRATSLQQGSNWHVLSPSSSELDDQMAKHVELESDILVRYGLEDHSPRRPGQPPPLAKTQAGEDPQMEKSFLPHIGERPSIYVANATLPQIAESFRKKLNTFKAAQGVIGAESESPPPRPPSRDRKLKIVV